MGVEKEGTKSSFFHLFDWKVKSRKKLFSNKSDLAEDSNVGKKGDGKSPATRLAMVDEDDAAMSLKNGDYSCASSVTDDDGFGSRAPGVVARLMGLHSLPTSNFSDVSSTPCFDAQSIREASQRRRHVDYYRDHQMMFPETFLSKEEILPARSFIELKPQKVASMPIEKFKTEVLPPKSAKPIPITHHKLLSPIKSPGFIPSNTAAQIMEAAAKIIDAHPQPVLKAKMPSIGSSSVPLKVGNLKKFEAASVSSRIRNAESDVSRKSKVPEVSRRNSLEENMRNSGKSISLAIQAKVNVQKREGLNSGSCKGLAMADQKEPHELVLVQPFKSQPKESKNLQKKLSSSGALKPNGLKQNSASDKDKPYSKMTSTQTRRTSSSTTVRQKPSSKIGANKSGSRKMSSEAADNGKGTLPYNTRNTPRKKRLIDSQLVNSENKLSDPERVYDWVEESKRNGVDVVSFTFTTPLARPAINTETADSTGGDAKSTLDTRNKRLLIDTEYSKSSSLRYNKIAPDALSDLLEQKLKDLTKSMAPNRSAESGTDDDASKPIIQVFDSHYLKDEANSSTPNLLSINKAESRWKLIPQLSAEVGQCSSKISDCRLPSPVSILDNSFFDCSISRESADSCCTEGSKQSTSVPGNEIFSFGSSRKSRHVAADTELCDSASSLPMFSATKAERSTNWEAEYVRTVLSSIDFRCGGSLKTICPLVFEQLEARKKWKEEPQAKVERKALFEFVVEHMDTKCRRREWQEMGAMQKDKVAKEVERELSTWKSMWNCMVDELLDKDMSVPLGRWLDFEADAVSLGDDIESLIFDSLLDELLS